MRTMERLEKLQAWTYERVCRGRQMKTPGPGMDVRKVVRTEPKVYLAFAPTRPDSSPYAELDPLNVCPGILIAPTYGWLKHPEEQRFDRYNNVHRPIELGQSLSLQTLFFVYEDGVRLPGFVESAKNGPYNMDLMQEGTHEGLSTLINWMDDFKDALLSERVIPGTDLSLNESEAQYGLYSDQKYVADRRPAYIGLVTMTFRCHADAYNDTIDKMLL